MTSPALAVELPDGSRQYRHPLTGELAPSVTTILKMIAKPRLPDWSARLGVTYMAQNWSSMEHLSESEKIEECRFAHERYSSERRDIGNLVHEAVDSWNAGRPCESPPEIGGYLNSYVRFLTRYRPEVLESEVTLWSRTHGYAGTADGIFRIGGKVVLIDVKTGKRVYEEAALQVCALAACDFIIRDDGTEEEIPEVDSLAVIHVRPRSWHLINVEHRECNLTAFLAAKELYDWEHDVAPHVLEKAA